MRRTLCLAMACGLLACGGDPPSRRTGDICQPYGHGQLRCSIAALGDCAAIRDYPYARNLFCPSAYAAAQTMVVQLATSLGGEPPARGHFYYYQTLADPQAPPDDQSQTTIACLETRAPWTGSRVVGAGTPLCRLIAYVTSPGPTGPDDGRRGNPIPNELRAFPQYFAQLSTPDSSLPIAFQSGPAFDSVVGRLGATGRDHFLADYPAFSADALYDPAGWQEHDPHYHGISGGGGGGWGGEIALRRDEADTVLLAFGGGGGGGMTSMRAFGVTTSRVGAGGGGGVQLADGYRFADRRYNGLGLGAGFGSDEDAVQYSYSDAADSAQSAQAVHDYNANVVAEYQIQLAHLHEQLRAGLARGEAVALRGGGGMGAGAEYLLDNGEEATPHALSTQAGFEFRYEFQHGDGPLPRAVAAAADNGAEGDEAEDPYALFGTYYRQAATRAYKLCGRDYANYPCICPTAHAIVLCLVGRELGDVTKMPAWLQQQHCPSSADPLDPGLDRLSSYQHLMLDRVSAAEPGDGILVLRHPSCRDVLQSYFEILDSPD